ncbi:MAG: AraC family transcriptional regulator [Xanthobacteraceae bacterium]|nr:AraC family transcriptional regulator [Xanthobacteraceae bacterium]
MVDLLAEEGIPAEQALTGIALSAEQLRTSATKVSTAQILQSCRNAVRLSANPDFAYRASSRYCVSTYGMYGFAALSSPNFRETIAFAVTYHRLATPLMQVAFREEGGAATWTLTPLPLPDIDAPLYAFIVKLHMGVLLSLHRRLLGAAFKPARVAYTRGQADDGAAATAFFDCPVVHGEAENRFVFDAAWLDRQPDFGNAFVYTELRQLCAGLLKEFELGTGVAGQVRKLILANLSRPVGFERVAEALNMSGRSLRRRLQEEGTSFGQLVDELRGQVAIKYVHDTDLSVEDIAFALGFSDASSFRHAFRRWTNAAPNEYRRAMVEARQERSGNSRA